MGVWSIKFSPSGIKAHLFPCKGELFALGGFLTIEFTSAFLLSACDHFPGLIWAWYGVCFSLAKKLSSLNQGPRKIFSQSGSKRVLPRGFDGRLAISRNRHKRMRTAGQSPHRPAAAFPW
jgi:hypothetical protein